MTMCLHHTHAADYRETSLERIVTSINLRPLKTTAGPFEVTASMGAQYYNGSDKMISAREMMSQAQQKLERALESAEGSIEY